MFLPGFGSPGVIAVCTAFFSSFVHSVEASQDEWASSHQDNVALSWSNSSALVAVLAAAVLCIVAVFALLSCTDCYNSEVSSDSHPAAGGSGARWGGAGGYNSAVSSDPNDRVLGAGFTGEVVIPSDGGNTQALPYSMIPTQVPESQGFRGYTPVTQAGYGSGGQGQMPAMQAAYGGGGQGRMPGGGGQGQGRMPGAHTSAVPRGEDEPPPSYSSVDPYH